MKTKFKKPARHLAGLTLLFLVSLVTLTACGDAATSVPASQPTAASTTAAVGAGPTTGGTTGAGAGTTPNAGAASANGGPNRGNFNPPVNGTVVSYDDGTKTLTVKEASGTNQSFEAGNARLTKTEKTSLTELGSLLSANSVVQVAGQKGSDGSYSATRLVVLDQNSFGGGPGANGAGPGGNGNAGNAPGAGGNGGATRGAGRNGGTPPANFTPGAGGAGGPGRFGGNQGNGLLLRGATLSGNKLTGTDFNGAAVTVNLSDTTQITKRVAGTLADLKAGETVNITSRPAQGNATPSAVAITIEE